MKTKLVTIDIVMSWKPCPEYTRERVTELFSGRETVSAQNILNLNIPDNDKLWAVLHNDFFTDQELRHLACDFAEDVLPLYEAKYPGDNRPRQAIETARRYADGAATGSELEAAWSAAGEAWSAAGAAAVAAAWKAAVAAAGAAARDAAVAAAGAAQCSKQVEIVRGRLA